MSLKPLLSQKPLSGSAPTTWLNANTSSWQSKAEGLLVGFPVFLYRSPVYTDRFQSLCGTWPIHHASVKNCDESKIPSQLQPIKVAYYSFISAGGLHETLEEKQRKPDFSVQKNCGVSAFWGLTPQAPLHIGRHREWDSTDGLCYRRDTNPELRKLQSLPWRGGIPTPCSKVGFGLLEQIPEEIAISDWLPTCAEMWQTYGELHSPPEFTDSSFCLGCHFLKHCFINNYPSVCVLSHVWLFVTAETIAHQASLSMEFTRQEYWSGWPFPTPNYSSANII